MQDDGVVLWRDCAGTHDLCFEIRQLGEGEFELRILCDGALWLEEESADLDVLLARARELHADVHPRQA